MIAESAEAQNLQNFTLGAVKLNLSHFKTWGKYPNVIVEILSDSTAKTDKELKKQIYQDTFRTPNYFWFDPKTLEFAGFILLGGSYQPIEPSKPEHTVSWLP